MNVEQLRKNIGSELRLRPLPIRLRTETGEVLPPQDWKWTLLRIEGGKVQLNNIATDHVVQLANDNIREYRTPDFLLLRCQLTLTERDVLIEPLVGG